MNAHPAPSRLSPAARPRGFTLVEVMISIALVLIIILGVNQVFGLTSQAVGAGTALSAITRQARSAQATIYGDFVAAAEAEVSPYLLIRSTVLPAFRDPQDLLADGDFEPTSTGVAEVDRMIRSVPREGYTPAATATDPDNYPTPRALLSPRTHRVDQLSFFMRTSGVRQTGDTTTFYSNVGAAAAQVTYTHLRQPNNAAADTVADPNDQMDPGFLRVEPTQSISLPNFGNRFRVQNQATNPNNYFATQWVLGRKVLYMRDPVEGTAGKKEILDRTTGDPVSYFGRDTAVGGDKDEDPTPLSAETRSTVDGKFSPVSPRSPPPPTLQTSYFDLVGMSMETYAGLMPKFIGSTPAANESAWHDRLVYRPAGYPSPNRPLTPAGAARTVPVFLTGCTQFCVEFAGDYFTQTNYHPTLDNEIGKITANVSDGIVDFVYEADPTAPATGLGKRTVRWYGYPRDTDGDGHIRTPRWASANSKNPHEMKDVLPVRDWARVVDATFDKFPFERDMDHTGERRFLKNTPKDYTESETTGGIFVILQPFHEYQCLWAADSDQAGFPRPKLIRITAALDDRQGRIGAEQYFEYVVEVP